MVFGKILTAAVSAFRKNLCEVLQHFFFSTSITWIQKWRNHEFSPSLIVRVVHFIWWFCFVTYFRNHKLRRSSVLFLQAQSLHLSGGRLRAAENRSFRWRKFYLCKLEQSRLFVVLLTLQAWARQQEKLPRKPFFVTVEPNQSIKNQHYHNETHHFCPFNRGC